MDEKPDDHPITKIMNGVPTYGAEADMLIRAIRNETDLDETYAWWEEQIGPNGDADLALQKARERFDDLTSWQLRHPRETPGIFRIDDYKKSSEVGG